MDRIALTARAKINLNLNVSPEKGEKGFYRVRFLNVQISLADTVEVRKTLEPTLLINHKQVDGGENIALRAARLMFEIYSLPGGVSIHLKKRIPSRAGLGGGSSDAAALINGLDALYGLTLHREEKIGLGKELGMDVCYCIIGGLALVSGIGDVIQPISSPAPELELLIATPAERKSSTAWAYSILDPGAIGKAEKKLDGLLEGITRRDINAIAMNLHNDFEEPIQKHFPVTKAIKESMLEHGALNALLAGSGLSVFGVFESRRKMRRARRELMGRGVECHEARTVTA